MDAAPETESPETEREARPEAGREPGERWARRVFAGLSVVAFVFYLVVGRHIWFHLDEWNFLAGRSVSVHGLLDDYGGHFVLLPVVVFRALFFVFGLRSYLPYQIVIVALHVTTAWLLRAVMRRGGVRPFTATAAASLFLFFGSGSQNILQAFQITFVGALAFGLVQLLLADHDGPLDRRDWLGLAAGFAAIACSGVGLTMLGVVAVAVLVRRGWRPAALHALAPLGVWVIWHAVYSKDNPTTTNVSLILRWSRLGLEGTFNAMGQVPFVGWLLALVLVAGLVLAARAHPRGWRRDAAIPVAFLAGTAAFLVTTGISRLWAGLAGATENRYLYVVAALLLPPLAIAADAIARRRRGLGAVMLVLLVVGIPGNLSKTTSGLRSAPEASAYRRMMLSVPRLALATQVPRSLRPEPILAPAVTIGWLLDALHSGRLSRPGPANPSEAASYALRLELQELDEGGGPGCDPVPTRVDRRLRVGESLVVSGVVAVQLRTETGAPLSSFVSYGTSLVNARRYHSLRADVEPIRLRIVPQSRGSGVCRAG